MTKTLATGAPLRFGSYYLDRGGKLQGPIRPLGHLFWAPDDVPRGQMAPVWDRHGRVVGFMLRTTAFPSDLVAEAEERKR